MKIEVELPEKDIQAAATRAVQRCLTEKSKAVTSIESQVEERFHVAFADEISKVDFRTPIKAAIDEMMPGVIRQIVGNALR